MTWVPLATSGVAYQFMVYDPGTDQDVPGFPPNVSFNEGDSTLTLAPPVAEDSYPEWTLRFADSASVRVRVTTSSFSASVYGGYTPAYFSYGTDVLPSDPIDNIADSSGAFVTEFLPSPFEVETVVRTSDSRPPYLYYGPTNATETGGNDRSWSFLLEVWVGGSDPITTSYNCTCDDDTARRTLLSLRQELMRRLGWGAQVASPPPGVADMLNSFLAEAQELLYRRYQVLRTERFYSWPLVEGVRLYDLPDNAEACTKKLDPRSLSWVGVERDDIWYPLVCGIPPELYSYSQTGYAQRYEIRQCIEVWPVPDETSGNLVIKGHFGLEPFAADADKVTIDDRAVFLMALANAKAHYRQPDAGNYVQQLEVYLDNLVAGAHLTRRYVPGRDNRFDYIYTQPRPTVPFS